MWVRCRARLAACGPCVGPSDARSASRYRGDGAGRAVGPDTWLEHVEVRNGDAIALPVGTASVDVVISNGVLNSYRRRSPRYARCIVCSSLRGNYCWRTSRSRPPFPMRHTATSTCGPPELRRSAGGRDRILLESAGFSEMRITERFDCFRGRQRRAWRARSACMASTCSRGSRRVGRELVLRHEREASVANRTRPSKIRAGCVRALGGIEGEILQVGLTKAGSCCTACGTVRSGPPNRLAATRNKCGCGLLEKRKGTASASPRPVMVSGRRGGSYVQPRDGWQAYGGDRRTAESCCTARRTVPSDSLNARAAARWLAPLASS